MAYSFQAYLDTLGGNWFEDDPLLQRLLQHHARRDATAAKDEMSAWGSRVAGPLRELSEESARPENRPRLRHFDAHNRRVDEVLLPVSTLEALSEVEGRQRLGAVHGNPFLFYAKAYLYSQNGESGVSCSMACTDGLVRALEALGDRDEHRRAVELVRGSTLQRVYHAAQFVTEIQGGSDVAANAVEAIPDGDAFRLRGQKWFCSNINADFFLVTARPAGAPPGASGVALFLVPAYLERGDGRRNGYTLDRLKEKLGTRELATAEVTFEGAIAYPVGALDRGIANLLKYVLTPSRFACASFAASALRQAERIASAYCDFRTAFGARLIDYPLVRDAVAEIRTARERALATVLELLRLWEIARGGEKGSVEAVDFRIMLGLSKVVFTREATDLVHEAMMLLGGNGIEESFSPLPRIYRDCVIMETWEGPHNVLLSQTLQDLKDFDVDPTQFVTRMAGEARADLVLELGRALGSAADGQVFPAFARLARTLVRAFSERALADAKQPH